MARKKRKPGRRAQGAPQQRPAAAPSDTTPLDPSPEASTTGATPGDTTPTSDGAEATTADTSATTGTDTTEATKDNETDSAGQDGPTGSGEPSKVTGAAGPDDSSAGEGAAAEEDPAPELDEEDAAPETDVPTAEQDDTMEESDSSEESDSRELSAAQDSKPADEVADSDADEEQSEDAPAPADLNEGSAQPDPAADDTAQDVEEPAAEATEPEDGEAAPTDEEPAEVAADSEDDAEPEAETATEDDADLNADNEQAMAAELAAVDADSADPSEPEAGPQEAAPPEAAQQQVLPVPVPLEVADDEPELDTAALGLPVVEQAAPGEEPATEQVTSGDGGAEDSPTETAQPTADSDEGPDSPEAPADETATPKAAPAATPVVPPAVAARPARAAIRRAPLTPVPALGASDDSDAASAAAVEAKAVGAEPATVDAPETKPVEAKPVAKDPEPAKDKSAAESPATPVQPPDGSRDATGSADAPDLEDDGLEDDGPEAPAASTATPAGDATADPTSSAWRRLGRASRPIPTKGNLVAAALALILGFATVAQVREFRTSGLENQRQSDLLTLLSAANNESTRLDRESDSLTKTRDSLALGKGDAAAIAAAKERLQTLGILSGTVPAYGPGMKIVINDTKGSVSAADLLDAVQELRNAGAESIQIGDVRVVANSWFGTSSDQHLMIDKKVVKAPYTILTIGDPNTLTTAMAIPGGVVENIERGGAQITVLEVSRVDITALRPASKARYAQPDESAN